MVPGNTSPSSNSKGKPGTQKVNVKEGPQEVIGKVNSKEANSHHLRGGGESALVISQDATSKKVPKSKEGKKLPLYPRI